MPRASRFGLLVTVAALFKLVGCGSEPPPSDGEEHEVPSSGGVGSGGTTQKPSGSGGGVVISPDAGAPETGGTGGTDPNEPVPYCGDGKIELGAEECDDADTEAGDGCSSTCVIEAGYACPVPGDECITTVVCGDGALGGVELCEDGNLLSGDGCDAACQLEPGWACPVLGLPCVARECGDSLVIASEECDDGNGAAGDGCDASCRIEQGYKCDVPGQPCAPTTCGDGVAEGLEQCDDRNFDLGDGCSPYCSLEPDCSGGACASACGDGILLGGEVCDDGNARDGDGCSAVCEVEIGFQCQQPPLADSIQIPLVIRDFAGLDPLPETTADGLDYTAPNHVDFELVFPEDVATEDGTTSAIVRRDQGASATGRGLDLGQPGEVFEIRNLAGAPIASVSLAGKPVYAVSREACDAIALPSEDNEFERCTLTTLDADSFHTWFVDADAAGQPVTWPNFLGRGPTVVKSLVLLRGSFDAEGAFTAGGNAFTFDSRYMEIDGAIPPLIPDATPAARTLGFFPVEELGATAAACGVDGEERNFHFTSEVRFWFEYDASQTPTLNFSGDDDVWVYVNGHLALDIGGIHARLARSFSVDAANAIAWGLEDGRVYEIAVFQAERNSCASNYWLTLEGFNAARSECESVCGDGIVASDEICDFGVDNADPPPYGGCSADCKSRGPSCGDGQVDLDYEQCDDGFNLSVYDFNGSGCAPGCIAPPRCGDGEIQSSYDEECDDGVNDGAYGGCTSTCELAPRCGDGVRQAEAGESCDAGPVGSASCNPDCSLVLVR